jgi:hypothetical protein
MQQQRYQPAQWKGSVKTANHVREEIANRWGEEEAEKYDPLVNCFTGATWHSMGYLIKKGEHAIKSETVIEREEEDENGEKTVKRIPRTVNLFYIKQVEKIPS